MDIKKNKEFQKVDYRPWNLVGLDQNIKNEDTRKVLNAKVKNSSVNINKVINKHIIEEKDKIEPIDYFKVLTLDSIPLDLESGLFPVSNYIKDCFNLQIEYLDNLRKTTSFHLIDLCLLKW
jgi:hypothetical protein